MSTPTPDPQHPPRFAPEGAAPYPAAGVTTARPPMGRLSIATFVVSFFAGLLAVVLGIFALRQNWVRGTRGTGLAWAGIIIGAVLGVAQTAIAMLLFRVLSGSVV